MSRIAVIFACVAGALLLAGCQRETSSLIPVNGVILFNGMPARASITAQVVDELGRPTGRPSLADTQPDGTFTLLHGEQNAGALIGRQQITISIFPHERAEGEFDFNQRFRPIKVVKFIRQVEAGRNNTWKFYLTF